MGVGVYLYMYMCLLETLISISQLSSSHVCTHKHKYLCRVGTCRKGERPVWLGQRGEKEENLERNMMEWHRMKC